MNLILPSALEDSYFSSAITLAITLTTFLLLIKFLTVFWLNDVILFGNTEPHIEIKVPKVLMSTVNVPFTLKLQDKVVSNYEGVHCVTSSQVCYRLEAYWGVSIADLHFFLRQPWNFGNITSLKDSPLSAHCQHFSDVIKERSHENKTVTVALLNKSLNLGTPPRHYYPLVIFLVRDTPQDQLAPHEAVAVVNIIHIKDEVCSLSTSLLAQYLKQANGRLTTLKQLYVESANISNSESEAVKKDSLDQLCIVCQVYPISRALLHCRHTCICAVCFSKLNACPLCRSPIVSYFLIRNEDYYIETEKARYTSNDGTFSQWFQDRITDLLGFER